MCFAKLLFLSLICSLLSLYNAFIYTILHLFFTTFTFLFGDVYHFNVGTVGPSYIGMGIGMVGGMTLYGTTSDRITWYLTKRYGVEQPKPEYRLPLIIFARPFVSIGLFIYGWISGYHVQWAVPMLGILTVGFGFTIILASIDNYLIGTFTIYA